MPSRESNFVLGVFGDSGTLKEALNQVRIHGPTASNAFVFAGEEQMKIVMAAIPLERLAPSCERIARAIGVVVVGAGLFLIARATGLDRKSVVEKKNNNQG